MNLPATQRILMALVVAALPLIAAAQGPANPAAAPAGEVAAKEGAATKKPDAADKAPAPDYRPAHKEPGKDDPKPDNKKQQATAIIP